MPTVIQSGYSAAEIEGVAEGCIAEVSGSVHTRVRAELMGRICCSCVLLNHDTTSAYSPFTPIRSTSTSESLWVINVVEDLSDGSRIP